jgi:hypothetical protein
VTQPPDDSTRRFDPFRDDDDSTRAMPPVPPEGGDDDTRFFPFGDDDRTRRLPGEPDETRAMPPVGGARGSAAPVPPAGNVYGGARYEEYDEEPEKPRDGKRLALIVGGVVLAILLVTGIGYAASTALFGSASPESTTALSPLPSTSTEASAEPTPSPSESASPPPPEGPGPRVLDIVAPSRVDCTDGGTQRFDLGWRVADANSVHIGIDGQEYQRYAPSDAPVSLPFACDGQAHKYQVTAYSLDDRQSRTSQFTVRPQVAATQAPPPLFPSPSPS